MSLSVTASGTGEQLSYLWKKDDNDIIISAHPCCEGATASVLSIACALPLYEGQYKCLVGNELGEVESQTAQLQVLRIRKCNRNCMCVFVCVYVCVCVCMCVCMCMCVNSISYDHGYFCTQ